MAIFFTNRCHFQQCGLTFETLKDLILHLEKTHLDNPTALIDRSTGFLPLSCIIRFYSEEEAHKLPDPVPINHHHHHPSHHHGSQTSHHSKIGPHTIGGTVGSHHGPRHRQVGGGGRRNANAAAAMAALVNSQSDQDGISNGGQNGTVDDTLDAQCRSVAAGVLAGLGLGSSSGQTAQPQNGSNLASPSARSASGRSNHTGNSVQCQHEGCNKRYKNVNGLRYHMRHAHNQGNGPTPAPGQVTNGTTAAPPAAVASASQIPPTTGGKHGLSGQGGPPAAPPPQQSNSATTLLPSQPGQVNPPPGPEVQFAPRGRGGVIMRGGAVGHMGSHHPHALASGHHLLQPATNLTHRCRFCGYACRTLQELHSHHQAQHAGQLMSGSTTGTAAPTPDPNLRLALTSAPSGFARTTSSVSSSRMAAAELLLGGEPPSKPLSYVSLVTPPQSSQQIIQAQIQQVQPIVQQQAISEASQPQLMQH